MIVDHRSKTPGNEFAKLRSGLRETQQTLGLHQNQRTPFVQLRLPPEDVEVLRRRRRIGYTLIPLRAQLQESLEARARVLRSLSLVAVWKEEHDSGVLAPLRAISGYELIDDRLRHVHKITVLSFPQHESILGRRAVAVLEAEHRHLRERAVVDLDLAAGFSSRNVLERNVDLSGFRIVEHCLAVRKSCAL